MTCDHPVAGYCGPFAVIGMLELYGVRHGSSISSFWASAVAWPAYWATAGTCRGKDCRDADFPVDHALWISYRGTGREVWRQYPSTLRTNSRLIFKLSRRGRVGLKSRSCASSITASPL